MGRPFACLLLLATAACGSVAFGDSQEINDAIRLDDLTRVKQLLDKGVDVDVRNQINATPLHAAAFFGNRDAAELLIARGAQIEARDSVGHGTPLFDAVSQGHLELVRLLIAHGADVNTRGDHSATPLSSPYLFVDVAKLLIDNGADVNAKSQFGTTPLSIAVHKGDLQLTELLLSKGADVNQGSAFGEALRKGNVRIVDLLIEHGAKVNGRSTKGSSPLLIAASNGQESVVEYLLKKGADPDVYNPLGIQLVGRSARVEGSAFDGTWQWASDSVQVRGMPWAIELKDGAYACTSCQPPWSVRADGKKQSFPGGDSKYDNISVRIADSHSVEIGGSLREGPSFSDFLVVSDDGDTLTDRIIEKTAFSVATSHIRQTWKRMANGSAGSHAISGTWSYEGAEEMWGVGSTIEYEVIPNGLRVHLSGRTCDARFDGTPCQLGKDPVGLQVSLRRLSDRTIEQTLVQKGRIVNVMQIAVDDDGESMTLDNEDRLNGRKVRSRLLLVARHYLRNP